MIIFGKKFINSKIDYFNFKLFFKKIEINDISKLFNKENPC